MMKCPECGKDVSNLAPSCPNCGYPIKESVDPMKCFYYCPICGKTAFPDTDICPSCKNYITTIRSLHESKYYVEKAEQLFGEGKKCRQVLIDEEISKNPLYNPSTTEHNAAEEHKRRVEAIFKPKTTNANQPKCPHCGSTNIAKISTLNRAVSVGLLGFASSKIGKQYECKNCKYKW